MTGTLSRAAALWISMVAIAAPAYSQAPTDAQRSAIRAQCRSDYEAHCASIPPGGMASLQCLQKNMSGLSSGCQSAVRAVGAPSESKAAPAAPAKTESEPAVAPKEESAAPPARPAAEGAAPAPPKAATAITSKPSNANIAAIRSACRGDYPRVCAGVPTGGAPALQCLEKNKSRVSAACQKAVTAVNGSAAPPTAGAAEASPAGAPPAAALVLRPMRPREELFVLRSACGADVRALCGGVAPGGGRLIQCIATQSASLSPDCRAVLSEFATQ